jgi:hypothetical protein
LMVTMSQKSSVPQVAESVSKALIPDRCSSTWCRGLHPSDDYQHNQPSDERAFLAPIYRYSQPKQIITVAMALKNDSMKRMLRALLGPTREAVTVLYVELRMSAIHDCENEINLSFVSWF